MPTKKTVVPKIKSAQEDMKQTIADQLEKALPALKEQLGEKKFEKRIKKAVKRLVAGTKKAPKKKPAAIAKKAVAPVQKTEKPKKLLKKIKS